MFTNKVPKKKKSEIKYCIKGLMNDLISQRINYHAVCNNKEIILRTLIEDIANVDNVGHVEFNAYIDALKRINSRLERSEPRYNKEMEQRYYIKTLKKILNEELKRSTFLLTEYDTIKDMFPYMEDSKTLKSMYLRETKRKKEIYNIINKNVSNK